MMKAKRNLLKISFYDHQDQDLLDDIGSNRLVFLVKFDQYLRKSKKFINVKLLSADFIKMDLDSEEYDVKFTIDTRNEMLIDLINVINWDSFDSNWSWKIDIGYLETSIVAINKLLTNFKFKLEINNIDINEEIIYWQKLIEEWSNLVPKFYANFMNQNEGDIVSKTLLEKIKANQASLLIECDQHWGLTIWYKKDLEWLKLDKYEYSEYLDTDSQIFDVLVLLYNRHWDRFRTLLDLKAQDWIKINCFRAFYWGLGPRRSNGHLDIYEDQNIYENIANLKKQFSQMQLNVYKYNIGIENLFKGQEGEIFIEYHFFCSKYKQKPNFENTKSFLTFINSLQTENLIGLKKISFEELINNKYSLWYSFKDGINIFIDSLSANNLIEMWKQSQKFLELFGKLKQLINFSDRNKLYHQVLIDHQNEQDLIIEFDGISINLIESNKINCNFIINNQEQNLELEKVILNSKFDDHLKLQALKIIYQIKEGLY